MIISDLPLIIEKRKEMKNNEIFKFVVDEQVLWFEDAMLFVFTETDSDCLNIRF